MEPGNGEGGTGKGGEGGDGGRGVSESEGGRGVRGDKKFCRFQISFLNLGFSNSYKKSSVIIKNNKK